MLDKRDRMRQTVWAALRQVAKPDSRFHFDSSQYICDFAGSDAAIVALTALPLYSTAQVVFVTPDNCLEQLRAQVIRDGKTLLTTSYGIRRGFLELTRDDVPLGREQLAVLLDAIERFARPRMLAEMQACDCIDLLVTGGSAVTLQGVRFGKGHGYFDLEWAMLYSVGAATVDTPIVAVVHDCQIVDTELQIMPHDTICDVIVTPTRVLHVTAPQKPTTGVLWEMLAPNMLESIPPLQELHALLAL